MSRKLNQKGFSPLIVAVAILAVLAIAGTAYYVWQRNSNDKPSTETNQAASNSDQNTVSTPNEQKQPTFSLMNGKVTLGDDATWKAATGGYFSVESGRCGQAVTSDVTCLDHKMLILSSEQFSNPDQFQVNVSVFKSGGLSVKQWDVDKGGKASSETIEVNGITGQVTTADYSDPVTKEQDIRVSYVFPWGDKMIVISSTFFNSDHNSFKNEKDYTQYQPTVRELVETLEVKE